MNGDIKKTPVKPVDIVPPPAGPQPNQPPQPQQAAKSKQPQTLKKQTKPSGGKKNVAVIVIAIIILLSLAGVAVYAGMQSGKTKNNSLNTTQTDTTDQEEVNQAGSDIDNLPTDEDDSGTGLSNENLGL